MSNIGNSHQLGNRIKNGIKFFKVYEEKYDSEPFKKYWPEFLSIVQKYVETTDRLVKDNQKKLIKKAKEMFEE